MTENDGKNDTYEKFEPTETNLDYKPDTSVPNTELEVKPEPGAKPRPEDEPGAELQVTGTLPYASSKQPTMETDYRLDKKTNRLYNTKTLKYRDMERGGDSDEDYIPEPELEQTKPDEPEEEQDSGDTEKGEELEEDPIKVQLKNYERSENPVKNLEVAKQFFKDNYRDASKSTAFQVITYHMKDYFRLDKDGLALLKTFWADLQKEQKEARKEAKKVETAKEDEEAMKKRQDEQREINKGIREKREAHIAELYDTLKNKSGTHTIAEIENAKTEIKNLMMPAFWDIEGLNPKTGNPGHLSLKKLPIADYINKAFNIVKFGGRNWWYDWSKAFYTYDSDDVYIQKEVCDIMDAVGDGDFYKYNGNITSDKSQIIDKASNVKVYTDNPFNKHTGYINTKNGVLHIDYKNRKVSLIGKKPEYMFSYCIDTEFHPEKVDTEIHRVLGENLGELQRDLIYQMAAIAIRDTDPKLIPSKIAYLFIGPRNTGKNVVMQILNDFFGNAIVSRIPLNEIAENKFVKPLLEGKVINLDDELPEHLPLTESREIKSLTGGKFHTLEPKNVKPYSGVITALLVFAGNQFPKCSISKSDSAFWDRWEIITFDKEQHKVDEDFLIKLLTPDNLSGFFNRVIDKLFEIHDHKIIRKKDLGIFETYNEWMYSSSTVYRFFQDMMVNSDDRMEYRKEEFFRYYNDWCEATGIPRENRATTLQEFGRELSQTCHVKEGRIGTDERHYVYRMFKRYEPDQLAVCLGAANESNEPEMYVVQPDLEEPDIPEEVCYVDDDGFLVREYVYKNK